MRRRIGVPTSELQDNFNAIFSPEENISVQVVDFYETEVRKYKTDLTQLSSNDPNFSLITRKRTKDHHEKEKELHNNEKELHNETEKELHHNEKELHQETEKELHQEKELYNEKEKELHHDPSSEMSSSSLRLGKINQEVNTTKQVRTRWISKEGTNHKTFFKLAEIYHIHCPVEVEEVFEQHNQTARVLLFQNCIFITCPILFLVNNQDLVTQQINILTKGNLVITFLDAESEEPFWIPILKKIKKNLDHVNSIYILSQVLLNILDKNSKVISHYGVKVDNLELRFTGNPSITEYQEVQAVKRELLLLRKYLRPIRDVIDTVIKIQHSKGVENSPTLYIKELERKIQSVLELIETLRELCVSMHELYDMLQDRKMNSTLYLLTIITILFVPASFLAGVYGTNFHYIPEYEWKFSYPLFWGFIITMWATMLIFFKVKGWIPFSNQP